MNFNLEINNRLTELNSMEYDLALVQARIEFIEKKIKDFGIKNGEYKYLQQNITKRNRIESAIRRTNREIMELKAVRKQVITERNIKLANNKDRLFRDKAFEILPEELFAKILAAVEKEHVETE